MVIIKIFKSSLIIFLLCFPLHFIYEFFPNFITSIFCPVNESIWEHMKLILTSYLIYYLFTKNKVSNYNLKLFLVPLLAIILYLLIYIPLYKIIGENFFLNIGLLYIIIIFECLVSNKLLLKPIRFAKVLGLIGLLLVYLVFIFFTYYPLKNFLFYDPSHNYY